MELKTIIYTTSRSQWIKSEFSKIYSVLNRVRGITVEPFTVEYLRLPSGVPTFTSSSGGVYIDWDWFKKNLPDKGHKAICLHITRRERDEIGMKHSAPGKKLGGVYNRNRGDNTFEFVVIADKGSNSYGGMTSFMRIFLHELSHGFSHWRGVTDFTHLMDYTFKNIQGIFFLHDFTNWNALVARVNELKARVAALLAGKIHAPLEAQFMDQVSQPFGVVNPIYKITGHHVGVDFAVPVGENCFAPADGKVVRVIENHPALGNATYYEFMWKGKLITARFLHQSRPGTMGNKKRGEIIGVTGNTGMSTGPHLHFDLSYGKFNLTGVNRFNFREKFIDPVTLY